MSDPLFGLDFLRSATRYTATMAIIFGSILAYFDGEYQSTRRTTSSAYRNGRILQSAVDELERARDIVITDPSLAYDKIERAFLLYSGVSSSGALNSRAIRNARESRFKNIDRQMLNENPDVGSISSDLTALIEGTWEYPSMSSTASAFYAMAPTGDRTWASGVGYTSVIVGLCCIGATIRRRQRDPSPSPLKLAKYE